MDNSDFHGQFSEFVTAQGFRLVEGMTLDACHQLLASNAAMCGVDKINSYQTQLGVAKHLQCNSLLSVTECVPVLIKLMDHVEVFFKMDLH